MLDHCPLKRSQESLDQTILELVELTHLETSFANLDFDQTRDSIWIKDSNTFATIWCQPIKLIQVVSMSEFYEYWWNDFDFVFFIPLHLLQGLRSNNTK